jgi:hypothetical protein
MLGVTKELLQAGFSVEEITKQCNISAQQVEAIANGSGIEV